MTVSACPTRLKLMARLPSGPEDLGDIFSPDRVIAIRQRGNVLRHAANDFLVTGPRLLLGSGTADELEAMFAPYFTAVSSLLLEDAIRLSGEYGRLFAQPQVRMRLERLDGDSCRRFHVDQVGVRLLCTYVGPGTEWVPPAFAKNRDDIHPAIICRVGTGDVALLKGGAWSRPGLKGVVHRSPPVSSLPLADRTRLLLTIDEPDACGMAMHHNPTVRT